MYEIESRVLSEQPTVVVRSQVAVADLPDWFGPAYAATARVAGAAIAGPPFARFGKVDEATPTFDAEAGFPVRAVVESSGEVEAATLPGGLAAVTWHVGPYNTMEPAYKARSDWLAQHGASAVGDAWEVYYSDPSTDADPMTWRTEIVQPYV